MEICLNLKYNKILHVFKDSVLKLILKFRKYTEIHDDTQKEIPKFKTTIWELLNINSRCNYVYKYFLLLFYIVEMLFQLNSWFLLLEMLQILITRKKFGGVIVVMIISHVAP